MESVVHEAFGDVFNFDVGTLFPFAEVDDEFVCNQSGFSAIDNWIVGFEAFGHIVGVEDGDLCGFGKSGASHHADVSPGDRKDACASEWSGGYGSPFVVGECWRLRMSGEEGGEVFGDSDGADSWSAAAVWDTEGFVEIKVADVGTD